MLSPVCSFKKILNFMYIELLTMYRSACSTPSQPTDEDEGPQTLPFWEGDYSQTEIDYYSGSESPSPSFQDFSYSSDVEGLGNGEPPHLRLDMTSPQYGMGQRWSEILCSPELLHPGLGIGLRHRRSRSTESSHSFRSSGGFSSASSYLESSSSAHSSTENLHLDSLDISESKEGLHSTLFNLSGSSVDAEKTLHAAEQMGYAIGMPTSPSNYSPVRNLAPHQGSTTGRSSSPGVSLREMLKLLTESGNQITSSDPDSIRQTFIETLQRNGGRGNGLSNFSKPTKMEVGTSATWRASERRRKTEPSFFCDLCETGFTRKNGLINHYRSHLGIADKNCIYCGRGFTTSLTRHMKKCKSNPNRIKSS
ncbi:hypothetical protein HYPSUDRAFT_304520 [Hypholoma sublateritium FD-334 SS-4]|uniref:C2H2-type domain-containing protein n=1 Tax=Hypholoma sublateritium (strain FD-334 SS-4) TaxID=945553 RepID=A0A0D2Q3N2_HYPSF|nr:hypothetical protein HYPSUDRAFT_304520 [Hypholoma sublateritium FD-334 SS-4]